MLEKSSNIQGLMTELEDPLKVISVFTFVKGEIELLELSPIFIGPFRPLSFVLLSVQNY